MSLLCRACLVAKESFTYVLFENVSAEVYTFCTAVEVNHYDELPKTICNTCHELLEKLSNFKSTCIQSQNTLMFQNNFNKTLPNVTSTNDADVNFEINERCEVVMSEVKLNNDSNNEVDLNNDYYDSSNGDEDGNNDNECFENDPDDDHDNENYNNDQGGKPQIEDCSDNDDDDDDEPLQEIKKKIKCTIRRVKINKAPKCEGDKKQKVFEYVCELCKSKFKYKDRYEAHRLEHQGQTVNKTCTICKKVFMTWSGLQRHTDSEHKVVRMITLCCKSCGKVFKNQQTLKLHQKLHELPEDHMSVCDVCGKNYSSTMALKLHLESHNDNRPRDFPCEHCGKKFFTKYMLQTHIKRLHTGQRYVCQICNYPFTDKYNLAKHVQQKHQGIKDYKCDICDKLFTHHSTLVIHKRIHSGEKPYSCAYCSKAFSCKNRLIIHHRTHTGERPHRCIVCNLAFAQLGSMKRHLKTHSKVPYQLQNGAGDIQFENPPECLTYETNQITEAASEALPT